MKKHEKPQDCAESIDAIKFKDEWETIQFGAYRYGSCSVCGRRFREYYSYEQIEAVDTADGDDDLTVIFSR